jgi:hypothetical protein
MPSIRIDKPTIGGQYKEEIFHLIIHLPNMLAKFQKCFAITYEFYIILKFYNCFQFCKKMGCDNERQQDDI